MSKQQRKSDNSTPSARNDELDQAAFEQYFQQDQDNLLQDTLEQADNNALGGVSWQASEYVHHHKSTSWFVGFFLTTALLTIGLFLALRDISTLVLLVVMAGALFTYANRKPRTLKYHLDADGLVIGEIGHDFSEFRSFSVTEDNGLFSVELDPVQRFRPATSVYFAKQDGEQIIDILSSFLPLEEHQPDFVDRLIRLARF